MNPPQSRRTNLLPGSGIDLQRLAGDAETQVEDLIARLCPALVSDADAEAMDAWFRRGAPMNIPGAEMGR